jgi:hypothetical protein
MENRDDTARLRGLRHIDRFDIGVSVRRTQKRGVQRARMNADVVHEAATPGQERGILDTRDRLADPRRAGPRTGRD